MVNLSPVRTLGYLPADPYMHYIECNDGNVWLIDTRSGRRVNRGSADTFSESHNRITWKLPIG